jgi:hypothetical protein
MKQFTKAGKIIKKRLYDVFGENIWMVGFRNIESSGDLLFLHKNGTKFQLVNTPSKIWVADPILRKIDDAIYLFVEYYDEIKKRGSIAVSQYDSQNNLFGTFSSVIVEPFHMSFPEVFEYDGKYYMIPETHEVSQLRVYSMGATPYDWRFYFSFDTDFQYSDTVAYVEEQTVYLISSEKPVDNPFLSRIHMFKLLHFNNEEERLLEEVPLNFDYNYSDRNGGSIVTDDAGLIRVIQKAEYKWYGKELIFRRIKSISDILFEERNAFSTVDITEIKCNRPFLSEVRGVHTYGVCENIEVIDINIQKVTAGSIKKGMLLVARKLINCLKRAR